MKLIKALGIVVVILLLTILSLRLIWGFRPKSEIRLLLLDKTVHDYEYLEHKAFSWVLKHNRYVNEDQRPYSYTTDYFGFVPKKPEKIRNYELQRIKITEIDRLVQTYDIMYLIDARGVYFNEWYKELRSENKSSLIYGGVGQNDYLLIKKYFEEGKPLICEYELFEPPTSDLYMKKVEELLDIQWTGWTGKYFVNLEDTKHSEIPAWLIKEYKNRNGGKWPFLHGGIILMKGNSDFIVLEMGTHLSYPQPLLLTAESFAQTYSLPAEIDFSNWFEIVTSGPANTTLASITIQVNQEGKDALDARGLSDEFPVILLNNTKPVYYFAADMSEQPVKMYTASLAGARKLFPVLSGKKQTFFWNYYEPLLTGILKSFTTALHAE